MKKLFFSGLAFLTMVTSGCRHAAERGQAQIPETTKELKMRFINIVPVFPDKVDYMISEAKRLYKECGIDEPTLCMTLHPQGGPLEQKIEIHRKVLHEMIEAFKGTPIKVGVLFQTVLGHRVDSYCTEPWQQVENLTKTQAGRMCILDENYRNYVYNMFRTIAAEHPYSLLIDDDFRQINGSGLECFCPSHMRQFNEGQKKQWSADELRQAIKDAAPGDPVLNRFEMLRKKNLIDLAKLIRKAIDSVDPELRCGYCTPGWEFMIAADIARSFAGKTKPFIRFCNGNYGEGDAKHFPHNAYKSAFLRQVMPGIEEFFDEADTCPQNRYSKSAKSMHAKLILAALNQEAGAKLWLTNLGVPDRFTERKYDAILAKYRKFYPVLRTLMATAEPQGFVTPLPEIRNINKIWHPLFYSSCFYKTDWQKQLLCHYGIPACYRPLSGGGVRLLTADMLRFFDDGELKTILAGKVLIDRPAAMALIKRGFSKSVGVAAESRDFWASGEIWNDGYDGIPFFASATSFCAINGQKTEVLKPLSEKTKILSRLHYERFSKDPMPKDAGPGCMLFDNELGGRVAVSTQALGELTCPHPRSRQQLIRLLEALLGTPIPLYVECDQNVFTRLFKLADRSMLLAVFNLNFDELDEIELKGSMKINSVEYLTPEGEWRPAPRRGNIVDLKLSTYECAILRLK